MDTSQSCSEEDLALEIMKCHLVSCAVKDRGHPCHSVATWQSEQLPELLGVDSFMNTRAHRPEPWAGHLAQGKILFIGSNPSFGLEEDYPNWTSKWPDEKLVEFGVRRFAGSDGRPFGATDGPSEKNQDRFYDMHGKVHVDSPQINHWRMVRGWVAAILNISRENVSANRDYAMTELVHCKSQKEVGVSKALDTCADLYLERILSASSANLIFVLGATPGRAFVKRFPEIPCHWGSWTDNKIKRGNWPESTADLNDKRGDGKWTTKDQLESTFDLEINGMVKTLVWFPRPGPAPYPKLMEGKGRVVDIETLRYWRSKISS